MTSSLSDALKVMDYARSNPFQDLIDRRDLRQDMLDNRRGLTDGESEYVDAMFGDVLSPNDVQIGFGPLGEIYRQDNFSIAGLFDPRTPKSLYVSSIVYPGFSNDTDAGFELGDKEFDQQIRAQSTVVHELVHMAQLQEYGPLGFLGKVLKHGALEWFERREDENLKPDGSVDATFLYDYRDKLEAGVPFDSWNHEEQARFLQHVHMLRQYPEGKTAPNSDITLEDLEEYGESQGIIDPETGQFTGFGEDHLIGNQGVNAIDQAGDRLTDPLRGYYEWAKENGNGLEKGLGYIAKVGADVVEAVAGTGAVIFEAVNWISTKLGIPDLGLDDFVSNTSVRLSTWLSKFGFVNSQLEGKISPLDLEKGDLNGDGQFGLMDVGAGLAAAWGGIMSAGANLAGNVRDGLSSAFNWVTGRGREEADEARQKVNEHHEEQRNSALDLNGDGRVGFGDIGAAAGKVWQGIKDGAKKAWDWAKGLFDNKKPLVIDLDGDGIETVGASAGAAFDWDEDGFQEATGWVGQDDAILVIDLNADGTIGEGDGQIDQVKELALSDWHAEAETDFEGLKLYFDSNGDGVFDAKDEHFSALRLWQDKNGDAKVDEGELLSLDEAEILSIDVSDHGYKNAETLADDPDFLDSLIKELSNNLLHGMTTLTKTDGSKLNVGDMAFKHFKDGYRIEKSDLGVQVIWEEGGEEGATTGFMRITEETVADGNVTFTDGGWSRVAGDDRDNVLNASASTVGMMLYAGIGNDTLTGSEHDDVLDGGYGADKIDGGAGNDQIYTDDDDDLSQVQGGEGFDTWAHQSWNLAMTKTIEDAINSEIASQKDAGVAEEDIIIDLDTLDLPEYEARDLHIDMAAMGIESAQSGGGDDTLDALDVEGNVQIDGGAGDDTIKSSEGHDILSGGLGDDTIEAGDGYNRLDGGAGDDTLASGEDNDVLIGGAGDDTLQSGAGDDTLSGGISDDRLEGGAGDDTYLYGYGYGHDTILDEAYGDVTEVVADNYTHTYRTGGKRPKYVNETRLGYKAETTNQELDGGIDTLSFTNANVHDLVIEAGGNDLVIGLREYKATYTIYDRVEAKNDDGSNKLDSDGNQVYEWIKGESDQHLAEFSQELRDSVKPDPESEEAADFDPEEEQTLYKTETQMAFLSGRGDELALSTADLENTITIEQWTDTKNRIEEFAFADGNLLDVHDIAQFLNGDTGNNTLNGDEERDWISAGDGDDTLYGKGGKDVLAAGAGDDELYGGKGNDFLFAGKGDDELHGDEGDDYLLAEAGDDKLYGGEGRDTLSGSEGDDHLEGGLGNDVLIGGSGDDFLNGGEGDDTYLYFRGDGHDTIHDLHEVEASKQVETGRMITRGSGKHARQVKEYRTEKYLKTEDGGRDTLQFGWSIGIADLHLKLDGDDLMIFLRELDENGDAVALDDVADSVTITDWAKDENKVEVFAFGNGAEIDMGLIESIQSGQEGDDTFTGSDKNDWLSGGGGDDTLKGGEGDDNLVGGSGDDTLEGGEGKDDLYAGDGDDTLEAGDGDDYLIAGDGEDTLKGGSGDDVLIGGKGDDTLQGGLGDDTYIFNRGDGHDIIDESVHGEIEATEQFTITYNKSVPHGKGSRLVGVNEARTRAKSSTDLAEELGQDTLQFGSYISFTDLSVHMDEGAMVIDILPLPGQDTTIWDDQVRIEGWDQREYRIEDFAFVSGARLDMSAIEEALSVSEEGGDTSLIASPSKAAWLIGDEGAQTLIGSMRGDILMGLGGGDRLEGGEGDDTYIISRDSGKVVIQDDAKMVSANKARQDELVDVNGDGVKDKVSMDAQGQTHVRLGLEDGSFEASAYQESQTFDGSITKVLNSRSWNNGGAYSEQSFKGEGQVSTIVQGLEYIMFGLSTHGGSESYTDIEFALYQHKNGHIYIYENGANRGAKTTYQAGDELSVARLANGTVQYLKNDQVIYTSSKKVNQNTELVSDLSILERGATLGTSRMSTKDGMDEAISWVTDSHLAIEGVGRNLETTLTDVNADGRTDVLAVDEHGQVWTRLGQSDGSMGEMIFQESDAFDGTITKTGGGRSWDTGGAYSTQSFTGQGKVTTIVSDKAYMMFGLSSNEGSESYKSIDFALYQHLNGHIYIYENGANRGSVGHYKIGDELSVERLDDGTIQYLKNGEVVHTSSKKISTYVSLGADISIYDEGTSIGASRLTTDSGRNEALAWITDENLTPGHRNGASSEFAVSNEDTLVFDAGISIEDLLITMDGDDLFIGLRDWNDPEQGALDVVNSVRIEGWVNETSRIEKIQFFNGQVFEFGAIVSALTGSHKDDSLKGTEDGDWLDGHEGDDLITAGKGDDYVLGWLGSDTLDLGEGNDIGDGGLGDDLILGRKGDDTLTGGHGNDMLSGGEGDDMLIGGLGDDVLNGGAGTDTIVGGSGNDTVLLSTGQDVIVFGVGDGHDTLISGDRSSALDGVTSGADFTFASTASHLVSIPGTNTRDAFSAKVDRLEDESFFFGNADQFSGKLAMAKEALKGENAEAIAKTLISFDGVSTKSIFFQQEGTSLIIRLLGHEDTLQIDDWFAKHYHNADSNPKAYIDGFYADGALLGANEVDAMVRAMQSFDVGDGTSAYGNNSLEDVPHSIITAMDTNWYLL